MTAINYKRLLTTTANRPLKAAVKGSRATGGRNTQGRITRWYRGGGNKRRYRQIDFRYNKKDIPARIEQVEYDPYRSAFIARVVYADGERRYILAPKGVTEGDTILVSAEAQIERGNRLPLRAIPVGTAVHAIELKPGGGAKLARSAGNAAEVVAHDGDYTQLKMPSSEVRRIQSAAWASVGTASNDEHHLVTLGKAGRARYRGLRPKTRGSARNPVDHPHGGGEGRSPRGHRRQRTRHGLPTGKGQKTRRPKKYSNKFIVAKRKPGQLMRSKK